MQSDALSRENFAFKASNSTARGWIGLSGRSSVPHKSKYLFMISQIERYRRHCQRRFRSTEFCNVVRLSRCFVTLPEIWASNFWVVRWASAAFIPIAGGVTAAMRSSLPALVLRMFLWSRAHEQTVFFRLRSFH